MLRPTIIQAITKPATLRTTAVASRSISTSVARMGEGDAGAPRSGGSGQGDAFTKRENADENLVIRKREMEKLQALKDKIAEHQDHLKELDKNVSEQMSSGKK